MRLATLGIVWLVTSKQELPIVREYTLCWLLLLRIRKLQAHLARDSKYVSIVPASYIRPVDLLTRLCHVPFEDKHEDGIGGTLLVRSARPTCTTIWLDTEAALFTTMRIHLLWCHGNYNIRNRLEYWEEAEVLVQRRLETLAR